jgi:voltage-gated potassium channel
MADSQAVERARAAWREKMNEIIFRHDTVPGRVFDIVLLTLILLSVLTVILESVRSLREAYGVYFKAVEWTFTIIFTIEYVCRLISARNAKRYARSFFGIVDLVAIAPTYLTAVFAVEHSFTVVRSLRLLRVFRIFKLTEYVGQAAALQTAIRASMQKIIVFLLVVLAIVIIVGAMMYQLEGEANGFTSIPTAMYWAIVTVTTVGYGDISPKTIGGRILASILMIIGYGIIAVPTGIVTFEFARAAAPRSSRVCATCGLSPHDPDAMFCKHCGNQL